MSNLSNEQRKEIARDYYESVSQNKVISARMSPRSKGFVVLKVYNPTFKYTGNITVGIVPEHDEILLISEIGVHGCQPLSKFK